MPVNQDSMQAAWEADYRKKGRLYGGSPRELPPFPEGTRILDCGCGDGKSLVSMLNHSWQVTAADFSPVAVSLAKKAAGTTASADYCVADALHLPFRDRAFDGVTAIHLLGHCSRDDLRQVSCEIDRVLRPGGTLYVVVFSQEDFRSGTGTEIEPATYIRGNGILTRYFTEKEIPEIFPGYSATSVSRPEWTLRVRGREYLRSEIAALFSKPC